MAPVRWTRQLAIDRLRWLRGISRGRDFEIQGSYVLARVREGNSTEFDPPYRIASVTKLHLHNVRKYEAPYSNFIAAIAHHDEVKKPGLALVDREVGLLAIGALSTASLFEARISLGNAIDFAEEHMQVWSIIPDLLDQLEISLEAANQALKILLGFDHTDCV